MEKLSPTLIKMGTEHEDLRPHLKVILAHLEKTSDVHRDVAKLIDQSEDLFEEGKEKEAKKILDQALELAEDSRNGRLLDRVHKAYGRVLNSSEKEASFFDDLMKDDFGNSDQEYVEHFEWREEYLLEIAQIIERKLKNFSLTHKGRSQMGFTEPRMKYKQGKEIYLTQHRSRRNLYVEYIDNTKVHVSGKGPHYVHLSVPIPNSDRNLNYDQLVTKEQGFEKLKDDISKAIKILISGKGGKSYPSSTA